MRQIILSIALSSIAYSASNVCSETTTQVRCCKKYKEVCNGGKCGDVCIEWENINVHRWVCEDGKVYYTGGC